MIVALVGLPPVVGLLSVLAVASLADPSFLECLAVYVGAGLVTTALLAVRALTCAARQDTREQDASPVRPPRRATRLTSAEAPESSIKPSAGTSQIRMQISY